ncbi:MAG: hypothetical protein IKY16_06965 [Bacteroidales bacterium]|nr:hypothetical protein [Bacteroidales bacterium]
MANIFENASRRKYRFNHRGVITTEDLWDLSLTDLDSIYKSLRTQVKQQESEESLLAAKSAVDNELDDKIEIVRHIVAVRQMEAEERKAERENAQKKQRIYDLIAKKQDEKLENMSIEELTKLLDE